MCRDQLLKAVGAAICADIKLDGDDWRIDVKFRLKIFGIDVFDRGIRLDKDHTEVSFDIDILVAKASVTIGVEDFKHSCTFFAFSGQVYLPIAGWQKASVRQRLFCFGQSVHKKETEKSASFFISITLTINKSYSTHIL